MYLPLWTVQRFLLQGWFIVALLQPLTWLPSLANFVKSAQVGHWENSIYRIIVVACLKLITRTVFLYYSAGKIVEYDKVYEGGRIIVLETCAGILVLKVSWTGLRVGNNKNIRFEVFSFIFCSAIFFTWDVCLLKLSNTRLESSKLVLVLLQL